jgi:hypothetical protein
VAAGGAGGHSLLEGGEHALDGARCICDASCAGLRLLIDMLATQTATASRCASLQTRSCVKSCMQQDAVLSRPVDHQRIFRVSYSSR